MTALMDGIAARRVSTARLTQNVLETGRTGGPPVLFVHGNVSSSLFWQPTMLWLSEPTSGWTVCPRSTPSRRCCGSAAPPT